jgi:peptidoglycan hydrolase-like protein with peptidoglycan-binding domain
MASAQSMPGGGHSQTGATGAEHQQSTQGHSGQAQSTQHQGTQGQAQRSEQAGQRETTGQAAGQREQSTRQSQPQRGEQGAQREHTTGQGAAANQAEHGKQGQAGRSESGTSGNRNQAERNMKGQASQSATGNRNQREQTTTTGQSERNLNQAPSGRNATQGQGMQGQAPQRRVQQQTAPQGRAQQGQAQQSQPMGQSRQGAAEATQQAQGVSVTPQQRTRIRETVFASNNVPRVDNVNFAVRMGTTVPGSVLLVAVPDTLIEIYPEWRDHEYFVVRDEVVIVDHSHRIVAVVPTGSSSASSSSESSYASSRSGSARSMNLSQDEIRQLQITLNQRGFNVGEPDGNFGPRTRAALMQFQQREGLQRSGQIDQQTMSALGINAGGRQGVQGGRGPSSTGQAGRTQQPSAANPSSGAGMNAGAGGTSSGATTPSTSGQSGATGNTMQHPSAAPGAAGTSSPSGRAGSSVNPSGGAGTSTGGAEQKR